MGQFEVEIDTESKWVSKRQARRKEEKGKDTNI